MKEIIGLKKDLNSSAINSDSIIKGHRLNKSDFYGSAFNFSPGKSFIDPYYDPFNQIER